MATTYEITGTFVKKVDGVTQSTRAISHVTTMDDTAQPTPAAPIVDSFVATPATIQSGQNTTLVWSTTNATTVTITPPGNTVAPDGQLQVTPTTNTTYTLAATNAQGTTNVQTTVTVTTAAGTALPNDIVDSGGAVVQTAYNDIAYNYSDPSKGLLYRFGAAATASVGTLTQRADLGSILYGSGARIYHQFGAENNSLVNDFVTSNGAAIYRPLVGTNVGGAIGRFCTYQIDRHAISQRPQLMWQSPQLLPPQLSDYISQGAVLSNNAADLPISHYRAQLGADAGPDRQSLVATQGSTTRGSVIMSIGTETAQQRGNCQLAVGKVPTAIATTNGGEFAFVALWDTVNFKGQIAVIALGSVPAGCNWQDPTNPPWYDWWHDWMDMVHPGLKNKGGWAFQKVIGYFDLPSNMKAPTHLHATTGIGSIEPFYDAGVPSSSMKLGSPLANNRDKFLPGGAFYEWQAKGGLLVATSQSEKTVCFIDLAPLFTYFNSMYFGSASSNLETQNIGMGPTQWPYMLADHPSAYPTIIKTITLTETPVGVSSTPEYNYWSKDWTRRTPGAPGTPLAAPRYNRVWVATRTGTLLIYSTGRWVPGGKPPDITPVATEIAQIGSITGLGEQITCLARVKDYDIDLQGVTYDPDDSPPSCLNEMCMVVDRKNRIIKWIQFTVTSGDSGTVVGSLADSRMDPVCADHVDAYHKSNKVVAVADYSGHRILTYRARTTVPLTYDGTAYPTIDVGGEFGGALDVPGIPFSVATSNAP